MINQIVTLTVAVAVVFSALPGFAAPPNCTRGDTGDRREQCGTSKGKPKTNDGPRGGSPASGTRLR